MPFSRAPRWDNGLRHDPGAASRNRFHHCGLSPTGVRSHYTTQEACPYDRPSMKSSTSTGEADFESSAQPWQHPLSTVSMEPRNGTRRYLNNERNVRLNGTTLA